MSRLMCVQLIAISFFLVACTTTRATDTKAIPANGSHVFILSGQSNMVGLDPETTFIPAITNAFGSRHIVVIKDALGGQPIRRWYKKWRSAAGKQPEETGDLYDRLMAKVNAAIEGKTIQSVTFIWMQGERDARESHGEVYATSLIGLIKQLKKDLNRNQINVVIGRLSDFDMDNKMYPHWTNVRDAQVAVADAEPSSAWVNTDDLNDGFNRQGNTIKNDLHLSVEGYDTLGTRFAEGAIVLINTPVRE